MKKSLLNKTLVTILILTNVLMMTSLSAATTFKNASGWAIAELTQADGDGFITSKVSSDFSTNITREEFCEIAVILYDRLGGKQNLETYNPFTDTTNPVVIKAFNAEIINGVGNNKFAPDAYLTREQLCVMIVRAMTSAGIIFGLDDNYTFQKSYTDMDSISSWAYLNVKIMNDFKIMNGSGDTLNPGNTITREQAVIMLERTFLREFEITDSVLTAYLGRSTEVVVPKNVTSIGDGALHGNTFIESIQLPSTIIEIGYASFREMTALTSIKLNNGLITIGEAAFELSENLESVTLPSTLKTISYMAFQDCLAMTEITIPKSVTTIDDQAFYRCTGLTRVVFENDTIAYIGASAFDECTNVVFVCNPGSDAETHALEYGYTVEYK